MNAGGNNNVSGYLLLVTAYRDEYRDVFLRVMYLPARMSEDGMHEVLSKRVSHPQNSNYFMDHAYFSATVLYQKLFEELEEQKNIDDLLEKAVSNAKIELDDEIILHEANHMYKDFMDRMAMQGIDEKIYLQYANTTKEDIVSHMKEEAEKRLKNTYLLNAIIEKEKIEVSDKEIDTELDIIAKENDAMKEDVEKTYGGRYAFAYDLKVRKVIDLMKEDKETK